MRTTVTLDPDVERLIKDAMRERSISFKERRFEWVTDRGFVGTKALAVADAIKDEELHRCESPDLCRQ